MRSQSILIIDDSKLINNSLKESFEKRGYSVTQAFDIAEAKEILRARSFDFALLDLVLPDGDGESLLPYLQIHEEIRVIVLTSDRDRDRREHLFSFGVVIDYITKDRHFNDMELAIVQLIERITTNKNLTILVVDDSNFMRNHLRIMLSKRGFKVLDAIDGKEALNVIKSHRVDAAMIDLEMPVMDGNRLLSAIKRDKANLMMPVMVLSGSSDPDKIAHVIKHGAIDFIKKPYATEELLLKVDKMMQDLKQERMIKVHEARFAMYNRAIDRAAIFFKLDKKLTIHYANTALCELLGNGIHVGEGSNFEDYVIPEERHHLEALKDLFNTGETFQDVFTLKSEYFESVNLRLTFTPLKDDEGFSEIIVIGFDVTLLQQKENILQERVELQLKRNWEQNRMLIQQSKMASMGEMIGHIGHQWRQPLNTLGLMFQKLNVAYHRNKLGDTLMEQSTEKAMRIISQMSTTIDDFRNFFKTDKEKQRCKLCGVVYQACSIIEPTLHAKGMTLTVNKEQDVELLCHKNELSQVIMNIITNGMDAIEGHSVKEGEIVVTIQEKGGSAVIIVDDNAGGIPEGIIDRIFEPYFTTKEDDKGTGIGLYMSKTIVEDHMGGALEVNNTLSGASFKVTLPIILEDK